MTEIHAPREQKEVGERKRKGKRRAEVDDRMCGRCGFCGGNWAPPEEDVAQRWVQEDSKHRLCGRHCCCPDFCFRRCYIRFSYIMFVVVVLVRLVIYAFEPLLFTSNNPFDTFHVTECKVLESRLVNGSADQLMRCQWCEEQGSHCWTTYPCMRVIVHFTTYDEENVTALLRASEIEARDMLKCTYKPDKCDSKHSLLRAEVQKYQQDWGTPGQQFVCLYNPRNIRLVMRARRLPTGYVRNWASLIFFVVLSAFGILLQVLICGCKYTWSSHAPESIRIELADKAQAQAMVSHASHA